MRRRLSIPVTNTLMGLGGFPGNNPLFLGMLGMHGTYAANMAITSRTCMIAIGARFDDRATGKVDEFASRAKIIHMDIDPTSISKNITGGHTRSWAMPRHVLKKMLEMVDEEKRDLRGHDARIDRTMA